MNLKLNQLELKPVINKSNGQINFSLPKKKLNQKTLDRLHSGKSIKFMLEDEDG